jgi:hypothetical protein
MPPLALATSLLQELERHPNMVLIPLLVPWTLELEAGIVGFVHEDDRCAVDDGEGYGELTRGWVEDGE